MRGEKEDAMTRHRTAWRWAEAPVKTYDDHFALFYGESEHPVAVVGRPVEQVFPVEFIPWTQSGQDVTAIQEEIRQELDFYLAELREPDPWKYARYHCGTAANIYSSVHWSYFPAGDKRKGKDHD
jgi:hypothetical protein